VHLGVDIATSADAAVCAVADGKVEQIWEDPMMGWCVALSHSGECMTVYKNLAKDMAEGLAVGNTVQKGQLLGYVGDTAMLEIAEDPHLHLEMTVKGLQVDPLDYFSAAVLKTLSEDTIYETELGK
jgi:murein DD-endopeptidase MepM/ murein hydrolase activator NlpD